MEKDNLPTTTGSLKNLSIRSGEFRTLIRDFGQWLRVFGYAESTILYSPLYAKSFLSFAEKLGVSTLASLSNNHVKRYMAFLNVAVSIRTGKTLSQNYKLNHRNAIKLFSKFLLRSKGVYFDASHRLKAAQLENRKWLTRGDISLLYNTCKPDRTGDMNRIILGLYYGLGLRRQEGVNLDLKNILWNKGLMYIQKAKLQHERFVPISTKVKIDIETYIVRYRDPLLNRLGKNYEKSLMISEQGTRLTGASVYCRLQTMAKKAGLESPLALHTLRHSIATHLMENGLSMESIGIMLGHRSLESTQIYTHLAHRYH